MADPNGGVAGEAAPNQDEECIKCTEKTWPKFLTGFGILANGLLILVAVLDLMTFEGLPTVMVAVYTCIFALIGLMAECRPIAALRSTVYPVLKYVYFVTSYPGRSIYYFFLGTITLNDKPLPIIVGVYCMVFACIQLGASCRYKLPVYIDPQMVKLLAQEKAREAQEQAQAAAGGAHAAVQQHFAPTPTPQNAPKGYVEPPAEDPNYHPPSLAAHGVAAATGLDYETSQRVADVAYENRQHINAQNVKRAADTYDAFQM